MVPSLSGLPPPSHMITWKYSRTYLYALSSPINMTYMIRQHTVFSPTARSSRQTWSAGYSLSTANFWLLSRSSITNRMLITVFDTYLNPSSPGACNQFHNILRLFNILPNFWNFQILPNFTKHGLYIRVASRVAERLKN